MDLGSVDAADGVAGFGRDPGMSSKSGKILFRLAAIATATAAGLLVYHYTLTPVMLFGVGFARSTDERVDFSFANAHKGGYSILVLGNSRIHRGIDPSLLGSPAYNFGYDGDCPSDCFYKAAHLFHRGVVPERIVLGLDYFQQFPSSNFEYYGGYFFGDPRPPSELGLQEKEWMGPLNLAWNYSRARYGTLRNYRHIYLRGLVQLGNKLLAGQKIERGQDPLEYPTAGGFYFSGKPSLAKPGDVLPRAYGRNEDQLAHIKGLLAICKQRNVKVTCVVPPCRDIELSNYTPAHMRDWQDVVVKAVRDGGGQYLDYARDPRFTLSDFIDVTHLSNDGARKFTAILASEMRRDHRGERAAAPDRTGVAVE
jgi:hypothetical protein